MRRLALLAALAAPACTTYGGTYYVLTFAEPDVTGDCGQVDPGPDDTAGGGGGTTSETTSTFLTTGAVLVFEGDDGTRYLSGPWGTMAGTKKGSKLHFTGNETSTQTIDGGRKDDTVLTQAVDVVVDAEVHGDVMTGTVTTTGSATCAGPACDQIDLPGTCTQTQAFAGSDVHAPPTTTN